MSTAARKQRRRETFRSGMTVRESAIHIKQMERNSAEHGDGSFGKTMNLQTAARQDGTGRWHRV